MAVNKVVLGDEVLIDLSKDTVTEEDVVRGKFFHKANGDSAEGTLDPNAGGGGDLAFNIHYGTEAPEDTSKLWVKTSEPSKVVVIKPNSTPRI